jgi:molybdopterin converting factor small subunit
MPTIEIKLYATLARYLPDKFRESNGILELKDGITIGQLLQQLNIPSEKAKLIFLDGVHADMDAVLKEGSRVGIFPPVGGG